MNSIAPQARNSSFSQILPALQLAIDSTSLGEFKLCPRRYYYSIVLGYAPQAESIHLAFGLAIHGAVERFHHARAAGADHDDAIEAALDYALKVSWDPELQRPRALFTEDPVKNRFTLVRSLVWYFDLYRDDPLRTALRANGKPAVELSFSFDSGLRSRLTGEAFLFCGHLDRLADFNDAPVIPDIKTTKHQLNPHYWSQFAPNNQFGFYDLAGALGLGRPSRGIMVDGMQILAGSTRFGRFLVPRDEALRAEWLEGASWWVARLEDCAEGAERLAEQAYPMNDKSCDAFGGCPFREVCARAPSTRQRWLESAYKKRVWDPLQRRGDI